MSKITIDKSILRVRTAKGFAERFIYHLMCPEKKTATKKEAYELTEREHMLLFNERKYSEYHAFRNTTSKAKVWAVTTTNVVVDKDLLKLGTKCGFMDRVTEHMRARPMDEAYALTEAEYVDLFGERRYSGLDSFKSTYYQYHKDWKKKRR